MAKRNYWAGTIKVGFVCTWKKISNLKSRSLGWTSPAGGNCEKQGQGLRFDSQQIWRYDGRNRPYMERYRPQTLLFVLLYWRRWLRWCAARTTFFFSSFTVLFFRCSFLCPKLKFLLTSVLQNFNPFVYVTPYPTRFERWIVYENFTWVCFQTHRRDSN